MQLLVLLTIWYPTWLLHKTLFCLCIPTSRSLPDYTLKQGRPYIVLTHLNNFWWQLFLSKGFSLASDKEQRCSTLHWDFPCRTCSTVLGTPSLALQLGGDAAGIHTHTLICSQKQYRHVNAIPGLITRIVPGLQLKKPSLPPFFLSFSFPPQMLLISVGKFIGAWYEMLTVPVADKMVELIRAFDFRR